MKILHTVQLYEPHKGGSEEVVRQISERLASKGHEVVVATGADPRRDWSTLRGVTVRQFDVSGNVVRGLRGDIDSYRHFISGSRFDVMLNYAAQIWSTDLCFDLLDQIEICKVLVPCGYLLSDPAYFNYFRELPRHLAKYDALVYMSDSYQDYRFGRESGFESKAEIIPNGAAREEFESPSASFKDQFGIDTPLMVLHVSNHYELKGHRRVIQAFEELDRDDVSLVLIGDRIGRRWADCYPWCKLKGLTSKQVHILENVPREWVVAAYKEADVFVLASDVECAPLVIYESMASRTPFVSLDCGNVRDNSHAGVIVDSPRELSSEIARLLEDREARLALGDSGHRAWLDGFTWDLIAEKYEGLYTRLVNSQ